jgi:hypothetical protein
MAYDSKLPDIEKPLYPEDFENLNDMLNYWSKRAPKSGSQSAYITFDEAKSFLPNVPDYLVEDILQWHSQGEAVTSTSKENAEEWRSKHMPGYYDMKWKSSGGDEYRYTTDWTDSVEAPGGKLDFRTDHRHMKIESKKWRLKTFKPYPGPSKFSTLAYQAAIEPDMEKRDKRFDVLDYQPDPYGGNMPKIFWKNNGDPNAPHEQPREPGMGSATEILSSNMFSQIMSKDRMGKQPHAPIENLDPPYPGKIVSQKKLQDYLANRGIPLDEPYHPFDEDLHDPWMSPHTMHNRFRTDGEARIPGGLAAQWKEIADWDRGKNRKPGREWGGELGGYKTQAFPEPHLMPKKKK